MAESNFVDYVKIYCRSGKGCLLYTSEVLTAQQTLLNAELTQVANRFTEMQGVINLYQALGGGCLLYTSVQNEVLNEIFEDLNAETIIPVFIKILHDQAESDEWFYTFFRDDNAWMLF